MKALVMISRVGQIVVLAIAFMACVGWNEAAGLQNNRASFTRKRVKDIVKVRYLLPHTNLHNAPELCDESASTNITFEAQNAPNNLNNQIIWNNAHFCKAVSNRSLLLKQAQTDKAYFAMEKTSSFATTAFSCSSSSGIADALQGKGYFSGFGNPSGQQNSAHGSVQEGIDNNISPAQFLDGNSQPAVPVYKDLGCTITICHSKGNTSNNITDITLLDGANSGDDFSVDGMSQQGSVECQTK